MSDVIQVRPVQASDVPAITTIYGYSVAHETASWEYQAPNEAEIHKRMGAILSAGFPYFVAVQGERVVGYTYASAYRPRIGYRFVVEDSVYVDRSMQGRGVGRLLLTTLIRACEQRGFQQMVAVIGDSENVGSIGLHRALGFTQVGLLPRIGYKFDRWLDSVLMQRALRPESSAA